MVPSTARLLFLLVAVAGAAAQTCPAAPSTKNLTCYVGIELSSAAVVNFCACACGDGTASDTTTQLSNGDVMVFQVPNTGACSKATCASNFPIQCSITDPDAVVGVGYLNMANVNELLGQKTTAVGLPGSLCTFYTAVCTPQYVNSGLCEPFLANLTVKEYDLQSPPDPVVAGCEDFVAGAAEVGFTAYNICNKDLCNRGLAPPAPAPSPAPPKGPNGGAIAAAVLIPLAVVGGGVYYVFGVRNRKVEPQNAFGAL